MSNKVKSALIAFIVVGGAFVAFFTLDYTDSYVTGRFEEAAQSDRFGVGETFSLDSFLQYYDWDKVCVVLPGEDPDFLTRLGRKHKSQADDLATWSLVFLKGDYVEAEIPIKRTFLEYPKDGGGLCFERWEAIFSIMIDPDGHKRLSVECE